MSAERVVTRGMGFIETRSTPVKGHFEQMDQIVIVVVMQKFCAPTIKLFMGIVLLAT